MHVVQRQAQENAVVGRPLPSIDQGFDLGGDVGVGCDYSLGTAGGAAGVEDHGATVGRDISEIMSGFRIDVRSDVWPAGVREQLLVRERAGVAGCHDRLEQGGGLRIEDQSRCLSIVDEVFQFGPG